MELLPLLMGILAIPIVLIVLLIAYIAKTNRLSRSTSALEAEVAAVRKELARVSRALSHTEYESGTQPEAKGEIQSPISGFEPPTALPTTGQPEPAQPATPTAPIPPARDAEVYVSPYRHGADEEPARQARSASRVGDGLVDTERDRAALATAGGTTIPVNQGGHVDREESAGRPSRTRAEWESLIGGRLLNWIGALAIIIGIGFFLGYGYQNNWISPALLVAMGLIAGLALLAGGDLSFRKGYRIFSQGLIGAGISILYLSVYASFNYFQLESQAAAFLMMCAVTVLTFVQAFRFNSLSVSLLGWAGGFLTPALVSTGQANEVALFTYIALLDAGLLAIAAFKSNWIILEPLTLAATCVTYILWYLKFYDQQNLLTTAIFLTIFWGLFHALDVLQIVRCPLRKLEFREPVAIFNAAFYYFALYEIVDVPHHDYLATVTLLLGAGYLLTVAALRGFHPPRVTEGRYALTGAVLLVIATGLRFTGFDMVFCWSIEALALVLAAVYWKEPGVLWGALLLYLAAIVKLVATTGWYSYGSPETFVLLINRRALAFLGLAAAAAAAGAVIRRAETGRPRVIGSFFDYAWSLILFVLIGVEIQDEFGHLASTGDNRQWLQFVMYLAIGVAWMAYALLLAGYSAKRGRGVTFNIALFVIGASICTVAIAGFSYQPIADFSLIFNIRAAAFAAELIGLAILLKLSAGWKPEFRPSWARGAFQVLFCLMIFVLCTAETRDYFGRIIDELNRTSVSSALGGNVDQALRKYGNLQQMALSLVWLVYSILLIGYGFWRRALSLRVIAIVIFGIAILKIFIYDLSFLETLYRIFSFIGLGLILLSVSFLYQRFKSAIFEPGAHAGLESR